VTGPEVRQALATVVAGVVPDSWTVYPGPPEVTSLPAVVIVPRSPYRRAGTFCADIYSLAVTLLVGRATGVAGVDELDVLAVTVTDELIAQTGLVYESTDLGPMIAPGGVEAYGAALNVEYYV